jgi:hypothetical protein
MADLTHKKLFGATAMHIENLDGDISHRRTAG